MMTQLRAYAAYFSLLALLLTPLLPSSAQAAPGAEPPLILVDSQAESQPIKSFMRQYIGDPEGRLSPEEAWGKLDQFFAPEQINDFVMQIVPNQMIWLAFTLSNPSDHPLTRYLSFSQQIPRASLFCPGSTLTEPQKAGPMLPVSERHIGVDQLAFVLTLGPKAQINCLILEESFIPNLFAVSLQSKTEFFGNLALRQQIHGLVFGAALLLILFHWMLYHFVKEPVFGWYALLLTAANLVPYLRDGELHAWWAGATPFSMMQLGTLNMAAFSVQSFLTLTYARIFLGFGTQAPRFTRVYRMIELAGLFPLILLYNPILAGNASNLIYLFVTILVFGVSLWQGIKGNQLGLVAFVGHGLSAWWFYRSGAHRRTSLKPILLGR